MTDAPNNTATRGRRMSDTLWTLLGRTLVRWFFKLFYRVILIRTAHVPRTGPLIIVANHQSHFDPPMIGILIPERPFASLAKASLFRHPLGGRLLRYLHSIPLRLDRSDPAAIREGLQRLTKGHALLIFPEGTRSPDGSVHEFQRGALLLIKRAKAPVLPVAVEGPYDAWPHTQSRPNLTGRIALISGSVVAYDELMKHGQDEALERLRREVEQLRLKLRAELRARSGGRVPAPNAGEVPYWEREVEE